MSLVPHSHILPQNIVQDHPSAEEVNSPAFSLDDFPMHPPLRRAKKSWLYSKHVLAALAIIVFLGAIAGTTLASMFITKRVQTSYWEKHRPPIIMPAPVIITSTSMETVVVTYTSVITSTVEVPMMRLQSTVLVTATVSYPDGCAYGFKKCPKTDIAL